MATWADLLVQLRKYHCQCGSGGPMACDDDCPGDIRDGVMIEILELLIKDAQSRDEARSQVSLQPPEASA
jgi:hypothetical protein